MEKIEPRWLEVLRDGAFKADFKRAVRDYDNGFSCKIISDWLDAVEDGRIWNLRP